MNPLLAVCASLQRRFRLTVVLAISVLAIHAVAPLAIRAQDRQDSDRLAETTRATLPLEIGFGGYFKLGAWTPIHAAIGGTDAAATGDRLQQLDGMYRAADSDGVSVDYPLSQSVGPQTQSDELSSLGAFLKVGQQDSTIVLSVATDRSPELRGELPLTSTSVVPVAATGRLVVVVGPAIGLESAVAAEGLDERVGTRVARIKSPRELPTQWYGLDGVDELVFVCANATDWSPNDFDADRAAAVAQWVRMGGRLIVFAGGQAGPLLVEGHPLEGFAPGDFREMVTLRTGRAIEEFCDGRYPLRGPRGGLVIEAPRLTGVQGTVLANEADLPLVIYKPFGLGQVRWISFDLNVPPLDDWAGRDELLRRVLDTTPRDELSLLNEASGLTTLGYNDLSGQLRMMLDKFEQVRAVSFAEVAGLALLYLALIGPLDYLLVHRVLKRPAMTWISLPIWILLISGVAVWYARYNKGDRFAVNQVEIVDYDLATRQVRGNLWTNVFAPRTSRLDLSVERSSIGIQPPPDGGHQGVLLSWLGLAGEALGGMRSGDLVADMAAGYATTPRLDRLLGVPISVWSTKSFHATWWAQASDTIVANLKPDDFHVLEGTLENRLGVTLEGMLVVLRSLGLFARRLSRWGDSRPRGSLRPPLATKSPDAEEPPRRVGRRPLSTSRRGPRLLARRHDVVRHHRGAFVRPPPQSPAPSRRPVLPSRAWQRDSRGPSNPEPQPACRGGPGTRRGAWY